MRLWPKTLRNAINAVAFVMSPGKLFRGHVLDENGHPISNAVVQTDWDNQGIRAIPWQTRTDANGYFEWRSAPESPLVYWFEAEGYQWQRDVLLVADGSSHEMVLKGKTGP
jgi:hypothetical protein